MTLATWLRERRRRRLLSRPFPPAWQVHLDGLRFFGELASSEQATLRALVQVFIAEKRWEGCNGLAVTEEMQVVIAAQACRLILHLNHAYYQWVATILVYPGAYRARGVGLAGLEVDRGPDVLGGETTREGPVVLSWDSIDRQRQGRDGHNLVLHEFAHKLDLLDGYADATPPLRSPEQGEAWRRIVTTEFEALVRQCSTDVPTLLDCYGATNPAEFFAVATELFFERPADFQAGHPELYRCLALFYQQDPAGSAPQRP